MRKVLIVVDMQNDFIAGSLGSKDAEAVVPCVKEKINNYNNMVNPIIVFTQDTHTENYLDTSEGKNLPVIHCIKDTTGWQIVDELFDKAKGHKAVIKNTFGYLDWKAVFTEEVLADLESGNATIEIIGVCTDICVVSNALILKAIFPETQVVVDISCCAATTQEKQKATIAVLESCQVFVTNKN